MQPRHLFYQISTTTHSIFTVFIYATIFISQPYIQVTFPYDNFDQNVLSAY